MLRRAPLIRALIVASLAAAGLASQVLAQEAPIATQAPPAVQPPPAPTLPPAAPVPKPPPKVETGVEVLQLGGKTARRLHHARPRHGPAQDALARELRRGGPRGPADPGEQTAVPRRRGARPARARHRRAGSAGRGDRSCAGRSPGERALLAQGDVRYKAAAAIHTRAPGIDRSPELAHAAAETALLAGDDARACAVSDLLSAGRRRGSTGCACAPIARRSLAIPIRPNSPSISPRPRPRTRPSPA